METSWQIKKHVKSRRHVNGRMFFGSLQSKGPKESCESISDEEMSSDESEALSSGDEFVADNTDSDSSSSSSQNAADVEIVDPPKKQAGQQEKATPRATAAPAKRLQRVHTCLHCPSKFTLLYKYNRHVATHVSDKQYSCIQCGKAFSRKDTMQDHYKAVHLHRYAHQCSYCGKTFRRPGRLNTHIKSAHS